MFEKINKYSGSYSTKVKIFSNCFYCILPSYFTYISIWPLPTLRYLLIWWVGYINPTHVWMHPTLRSGMRKVFRVQLYKKNARSLLSRNLTIVSSNWLQHSCSVRELYEMTLVTVRRMYFIFWENTRSLQKEGPGVQYPLKGFILKFVTRFSLYFMTSQPDCKTEVKTFHVRTYWHVSLVQYLI